VPKCEVVLDAKGAKASKACAKNLKNVKLEEELEERRIPQYEYLMQRIQKYLLAVITCK